MSGAVIVVFCKIDPFASAEVINLSGWMAIRRDLAANKAEISDQSQPRPHQDVIPPSSDETSEREMPMKKLAIVGFAAVMAAISGPLLAQSSANDDRNAFYCEERKLGSWFYCNPEKTQREARERAEAAVRVEPAVKRMEAITQRIDELKARAILDPSQDNIVNYIRFQREQLDRASTFADVWSRAIWQNPELDYTLQRPVGTLSKQTWLGDRRDQRNGLMEALTQRYGVFYFYSSTCSACRVFSPVMRALSDRYGLEVLAVSMDGGPNEHFPNFVIDQGQYQRMGLQGGTVPATVLFDTKTKQPIPIGYGVMAADDVMQRIFSLTQLEPGSDY